MGFWIGFMAIVMLLMGRYRWPLTSHFVSEKGLYDVRFLLGSLFIILFAAVRYDIGYDWPTYNGIIYEYKMEVYSFRDVVPSILFYIAAKLDSSLFAFGALAIITYGLIAWGCKKYSESPYEAMIIYLSLFFLPSLSTIRQAAAVAVLLCGYGFIRRKQFVRYFIVCVIAAMFHKFAIIAVSIYLLYYMPLSLLLIGIGGLLVAMRLLVFLVSVVPALKDSYIGWYLVDRADKSGVMICLVYAMIVGICVFLLLWKRRQGRTIDYETIGLLKICIFGAALPYMIGAHTGGRVADYYLFFFLLLLPKCLDGYSPVFRKLTMVPFYIYFFAFLWVTVALSNSNAYVPYHTYWF